MTLRERQPAMDAQSVGNQGRLSKDERQHRQLKRLETAIDAKFRDVVPRDKPDFLVQVRGIETGVEVTDGSSEELRRALVIKDDEGLKHYSVTGFRDCRDTGKTSNPELLARLKDGEAVSSEEAALFWAERIASRIRTKVGLLRSGEIERFQQNWLCVVNEQPDDWSLKTEFYRGLLLGSLGSSKALRESFDVIYVLSDFHIFIIDRTHFRAERLKD
ncbi:MAG TPA: hypothetical protein VMM36_00855 [Opitutaceae bacterium]|nr:hypothetical protein [Opitutaceae bacterium]